MAAEYTVELRDFTTGDRLAMLAGELAGTDPAGRNGFYRLACILQVNSPGRIELQIPGDHALLATLPARTLAIVRRRDLARGLAKRVEFVGVVEDLEITDRDGRNMATLRGQGLLGILDWYGVLWPAGVTDRTVWYETPAETIAKNLVTYNAVQATATQGNGRDLSIVGAGVTVQADTGAGTMTDWSANRSRSLLAELQALAAVAGGDIDVTYVSPTVREFRFYTGQRGTNRTSSARFAKHLGNINNIVFKRTRSTERTIALVAGEGTGTTRTTASATGANYSPINNYKEMYVDARDLRNAASNQLQARAQQRLDEMQSRDVFTFDIVQTEGSYYGGTYDFGDLVTVTRPDGVAVAQQLYRVSIDWTAEGRNEIKVEARTL